MASVAQVVNGYLTTIVNPNDISCFVPGVPTANLLMMAFMPARTFVLPINLTGSRAKASVAATASTTFTILKSEENVGSINFAISATTGTFTFGSAETFSNTDELTIVAPASPDSTLADIRITLAGTK